MRVMLVYSNRTRVMEPAPPIGLSYVATATQQAGHAVQFVDLMVSRDPAGTLTDAVREFRPDVVGFSIRNIDNIIAQRVSWHIGEVQTLITRVRERSRAPIVIGGPAASILGTRLFAHLDVDFVVVGEGEVAFPELLAAIAGGADARTIPGVCARESHGVTPVDPIRQPTLGRSGMEAWIDWRPYERAGGTWAIQTKRGCALSCLYCSYPTIEGRQCRSRTAADVVDEIEQVAKAVGPRTFEFVDSTFNVPESHAVAICEEIIRRRLRVNLSAASVNPIAVSPDLFALMKRAGFCSMVITPDSASETMLRNLRKGFGVAQVHRVAEMAEASGIPCAWFFLLGGPGETRSTVEETVSFVETHLRCRRFLTIFLTGVRLLPGTALTRQAIAERYIAAEQDLSEPLFYVSPGVDEAWVLERINRAIALCPAIVHGVEQTGSVPERVFNRVLHWLDQAPPYYRFLPTLLRMPPVPALRARESNTRARVAATP